MFDWVREIFNFITYIVNLMFESLGMALHIIFCTDADVVGKILLCALIAYYGVYVICIVGVLLLGLLWVLMKMLDIILKIDENKRYR